MRESLDRVEGHAKHMFSSLVAWFTFFITINWASLGWLSANLSSVQSNPLTKTVSYIFAWQDFLAVATCCLSVYFLYRVRSRITILCKNLADEQTVSTDFPAALYIVAIVGMIVAIIPILVIWLLVPRYFT